VWTSVFVSKPSSCNPRSRAKICSWGLPWHGGQVGQLFTINLLFVSGGVAAAILILAALHSVERRVAASLFWRIGWRASLYPTAFIGVPVHELSHLIAIKLFGHRVVAYSLFEPDPSTGTLGYVRHAYRRRNAWQLVGTFFIGIAPFVAGAVLLSFIGATLLPADARQEVLERGQALLAHQSVQSCYFKNLVQLALFVVTSIEASPWLVLQLYLAVAIASHMAPSLRDLAGGLLGGFLFSIIVAMGVTLLTAAELTVAPFVIVLVPLTVFALLAVLLQAAYVAIVILLTRPARRILAPSR